MASFARRRKLIQHLVEAVKLDVPEGASRGGVNLLYGGRSR